MKRFIMATTLLLVAAIAGCAAYPSQKVLRKIQPGMTRAEIKDRLEEEPEKAGRIEDYFYMKYYLVDDKAVGTAHYFYFDRELRLVKWEEDKDDEIVDTNDVLFHLLTP